MRFRIGDFVETNIDLTRELKWGITYVRGSIVAIEACKSGGSKCTIEGSGEKHTVHSDWLRIAQQRKREVITCSANTGEHRIRERLKLFIEEFLPTLDCDGCTRFVAIMLSNKKIPFTIYTGGVRDKENHENSFPIHYWLLTKKGTLFDFKTEKWLGIESDQVEYVDAMEVKPKWITLGLSKAVILGTLLVFGNEPWDSVVRKAGLTNIIADKTWEEVSK